MLKLEAKTFHLKKIVLAVEQHWRFIFFIVTLSKANVTLVNTLSPPKACVKQQFS